MSKQSNEVAAAARDMGGESVPARGKGPRPNRDEFIEAKNHADDVLGLDEKVSDGLRRAMARFANSPLTLMMEVLNDPEQPWERRLDAAERAKPYLHRKLEDKHGTTAQPAGDGAGSTGRATGPTINLTVNRPSVTVNERERTITPSAPARPSAAAQHAASEAATQAAASKRKASEPRPKAFKKPKKVAK